MIEVSSIETARAHTRSHQYVRESSRHYNVSNWFHFSSIVFPYFAFPLIYGDRIAMKSSRRAQTRSECFSPCDCCFSLFSLSLRRSTIFRGGAVAREFLCPDESISRLNFIEWSAIRGMNTCARSRFVRVRLYPLLCYLKVWHVQPRSPNYEKRRKLARASLQVSRVQLRILGENSRDAYEDVYNFRFRAGEVNFFIEFGTWHAHCIGCRYYVLRFVRSQGATKPISAFQSSCDRCSKNTR